jgi:hypothetical protein
MGASMASAPPDAQTQKLRLLGIQKTSPGALCITSEVGAVVLFISGPKSEAAALWDRIASVNGWQFPNPQEA